MVNQRMVKKFKKFLCKWIDIEIIERIENLKKAYFSLDYFMLN